MESTKAKKPEKFLLGIIDHVAVPGIFCLSGADFAPFHRGIPYTERNSPANSNNFAPPPAMYGPRGVLHLGSSRPLTFKNRLFV